MHVDMGHGLPRRCSVIDPDVVAVRMEQVVECHLSKLQHLQYIRPLGVGYLKKRADMAPWNNQRVPIGNWKAVSNNDRELRGVNNAISWQSTEWAGLAHLRDPIERRVYQRHILIAASTAPDGRGHFTAIMEPRIGFGVGIEYKWAAMTDSSSDAAMRLAAFEHVRRLGQIHDQLTAVDLRPGFTFEGHRIPLVNPQRGIFKPRQMQFLLSIRTVFPKPGARIWYDDQRNVHRQIYEANEAVDYAFMGTNADAADNRWLREAMDHRVPVIYFLGVAPGRFQAFFPAFIAGWDASSLKASVTFGLPDKAVAEPPENSLERRYALRVVQQRLHQASFREAVISAYNGRCALSGLPEPLLLDAAHIIADKDERLGQPLVENGIPLSKIHHAAFDAHLLGIDADYRIHVSDRLLIQRDGPMLESLKQLHRGALHLPERVKDRPDRDRLQVRFKLFKEAA